MHMKYGSLFWVNFSMYVSILNIENFQKNPSGAKNHDGQKAKKKADIAKSNSPELYDILTTTCIVLYCFYSDDIHIKSYHCPNFGLIFFIGFFPLNHIF